MNNIQFLAGEILKSIPTTQGTTIDQEGDKPQLGYMVSHAMHERIIPMSLPLSEVYEQIERYVQGHIDLIESHEDFYFGAWVDKGRIYLDVSINVQDYSEAIRQAKIHKQIAFYDILRGKSILTK